MSEYQYVNGFAKDDFIEYMRDNYPEYKEPQATKLLKSIVNYVSRKDTVSKDQLFDNLKELLPDVNEGVLAMFVDPNYLTASTKEEATLSSLVIEYGVLKECLYKSAESIVIPDVVKGIGHEVFGGFSNLKSITIPNSVTSIGKDAFNNCTSLESITIPDSVTSIGAYAFYYCTSLENVTLPDSVKRIGGRAFSNCRNLKSITLPDSVTHIGSWEFMGCISLESITIPDSVTSIGDNAFRDCASLESITIPDSVTSIGDCAFWFCEDLKSITIPDSVTEIGVCVFHSCTNLKSVSIPQHLNVSHMGLGVSEDVKIIRRGDPEKKPSLKDKIAGAQKKADEHNAGSTQLNIDAKKQDAR